MNQRRPYTGVLNQGEIEGMILALSDELETTTYSYADLSDSAAIAEADYKLIAAKEFILLSPIKMTVQERGARVDVSCTHEFRAWKIAEARRQSAKEALLSLRGRIDATRTLSANVRNQT